MITVIDAIMGAGKTTYVLNMLKQKALERTQAKADGQEGDPTRFLIVAPTLDEVDRYQTDCPEIAFRNPQPVKGRKLYGLKELIAEGADICTTHSLFRLLDRRTYSLLKSRRYVLIIDEVLICIDHFKSLTESDRDMLRAEKYLCREPETNRLTWSREKNPAYKGAFEAIQGLCDNGNLVYARKTLLWEFPTEFLSCFESAYLLTYQFEGSPMSFHLKAHGVPYTLRSLRDGQVIDFEDRNETAIKAKLKELITVYPREGSKTANFFAEPNALSSGWYKRDAQTGGKGMQRLKTATEAFFRYDAKTGSSENGWTTFKARRMPMSGKGYTKGWIPSNMKATNKFKDKASMAYLCNVFLNPVVKGRFTDRGVPVNEDLYALSEMLQWIWRSRIRDDQPINLFIPSARMRGLFLEWLHSGSAANDNITMRAELAA